VVPFRRLVPESASLKSTHPPSTTGAATFADLGLSDAVLAALADVGYEAPSPIQAQTIPALVTGSDLLGQAETGTGKTAAFALPILTRIDTAQRRTQALVLTPTRELAIQVAEAFQRYAGHIKGFHVLPIYGGQSYQPQLASLRRGAHVVVGTPGRVMDHLKRGTLDLGALATLVLDEADEMLAMGFIDDVEWILEQTPAGRQVALFSATLPPPIRRIAERHQKDPVAITIKGKTGTAANVRQRFWVVSGVHKLDALTRILEAEPFDGMLVFVRTKQSTVELAERLEARGFAAAPLNGDMAQKERERTVARLKNGQLDILVATDVAARGLDVERVDHVVNYDIPYDSESYVHRIGRTGRAGRSGEAILFVTPRERNMLRTIERATRQTLEQMQLPTVTDVNERRVAKFMQRITDALEGKDTLGYRALIEQYEREHNVPAVEVAAALASLLQGKKPLLLEPRHEPPPRPLEDAPPRARPTPRGGPDSRPPVKRKRRDDGGPDMETFRIEVGHAHGVKPGNVIGAIANEAGLEGRYIGRLDIRDDHSFIELPTGMPKEIFQTLKKTRVAGQPLRISRASRDPGNPKRRSK
jgi:ATP-dependent RNA helicase DeaD